MYTWKLFTSIVHKKENNQHGIHIIQLREIICENNNIFFNQKCSFLFYKTKRNHLCQITILNYLCQITIFLNNQKLSFLWNNKNKMELSQNSNTCNFLRSMHPGTQDVFCFSGRCPFHYIDNFFVAEAIGINSTLYYKRVFSTC